MSRDGALDHSAPDQEIRLAAQTFRTTATLSFKPRRALPRLPSKVDLRTTGFMPSVYDQGYLGSCTANAVAGAFEYEQKRQGLVDFNPARLFIYYEERRMINTLNEDSGAFIRDGLKVVNKLGAPHESLWPYDINRFTVQPNSDVYDDGEDHQAIGYATVDNRREFDVKQALALGVPVVFGFTVFPLVREARTRKGFCHPVANATGARRPRCCLRRILQGRSRLVGDRPQ
jgi:hypothetical protein